MPTGGRRTIVAFGGVVWDNNAIRLMLSGETGDTAEEIRRRARAVQKRAQYKAPFRTGRLRYSISVNTVSAQDGYTAEVTADAPYAAMVEYGRKRIDLTGTKRWLYWEGPTGSVFTQTAAAVPGVYFMRDALDAAADSL